MSYEKNITSFNKIYSEKAQELVKGNTEAIIYVGKATCPFCQTFIEKLKKVSEETGTTVYYVDSAEKSDMKGITYFRNKYDIPTVPGLIYTNKSAVNVKCESSMSEEEIKAYINSTIANNNLP